MDTGTFERFTRELAGFARSDERVVGLIALGSMAKAVRRDEWSDHDFWLVSQPGQAEAIRVDSEWLPDGDRLVLRYRETAHGVGAVYDDGHLIEFAVFEPDELDIARANDYEVLVDDGTLAERMRQMAARTHAEQRDGDPEGSNRFGAFVAQMVIGLTRYGRGERLSANHLLRGWALRSLIACLPLGVEGDRPEVLDNLDPHRRFEQASPRLAARLDAAMRMPVPDAARVLIDTADEFLTDVIPSAEPAVFEALRTLLARVQAASNP